MSTYVMSSYQHNLYIDLPDIPSSSKHVDKNPLFHSVINNDYCHNVCRRVLFIYMSRDEIVEKINIKTKSQHI